MEVNVRECGETTLVELIGRMTHSDTDIFQQLILSLSSAKPKRLIIDLSSLGFVDSVAIGMFLILQDDTVSNGGLLTLYNPSGQVKQVFNLTRMRDFLTIRLKDEQQDYSGPYIVLIPINQAVVEH